jgi:hypothetical protein
MSIDSEDLYALLGVAPDATEPEIRRSYRDVVERYHPDRHQGNPLSDLANARVQDVNRAYAVLSDPVRRAEYDARRGAPNNAATPPHRRPGARALTWLGLLLLGLLALRVMPTLARMTSRVLEGGITWVGGVAVSVSAIAGLLFWRRWRRRRGS